MDYTITRTIRTNYMDNNGLAIDGYRVYFTMSDGTADYVEVPRAKYDKTNVEGAIEAAIAAHVAVWG